MGDVQYLSQMMTHANMVSIFANSQIIARCSLSCVGYPCSVGFNLVDANATGLHPVSSVCVKTPPMPISDASVVISYGNAGSAHLKTGALVKASFNL